MDVCRATGFVFWFLISAQGFDTSDLLATSLLGADSDRLPNLMSPQVPLIYISKVELLLFSSNCFSVFSMSLHDTSHSLSVQAKKLGVTLGSHTHHPVRSRSNLSVVTSEGTPRQTTCHHCHHCLSPELVREPAGKLVQQHPVPLSKPSGQSAEPWGVSPSPPPWSHHARHTDHLTIPWTCW